MKSKKTSLLLELSETDFKTVQDEFEFIFKKGYLCHYVVDAYELREFCYPLGTRLEDTESLSKTIGYIADEQYVFTRLFEGETEKVILLDEYLPELLTLKKVVTNTTIEASSSLFKLQEYYKLLNADIKLESPDLNEMKEIIRTKLTQALSIILDKDLMGLKKVIHLIKSNKILHSQEGLSTVERTDILKVAFDTHQGSELTNGVFSKIMSLDFMNPENKSSNIRAAAFYRDARVVDRLSAINNFLHSMYKRKKVEKLHLIYYFSSTPKSHQLFLDPDILKLFPKVNNKIFNPVRNKRQLFLKYLCLSKTYDESVYNLNYLQDKLTKIKGYYAQTNSSSQFDPAILDNLKKEFNHYREYFENNAILNKYASIKDILETAIKFLKKTDNSKNLVKLAEFIKKIGENTTETTIDKLNSLDDWDMQLRFSYFLTSYLLGTGEKEVSLTISTGKDIIRGAVHHLPILINFSEKSTVEKYHFFVESLMRPQKEIVLDSVHTGLISDRSPNEFSSKIDFYEEKLFKSFILLLAPHEIFPKEQLDQITCEWVKNALITRIIPNQTKKGFSVLAGNYYYYIGWALRRSNAIKPSIKWFKDAIKIFPKDGRFYHGLCLSEFCLSEEIGVTKKEDTIDLLFSSIKNAELAISKYTNPELAYVKSRAALKNTIAYLYAKIYHLADSKTSTSSQNLIKLARKNIDDVKNEEVTDFYKYPEYLHTDAVVNYYEYALNVALFEQSNKFEYLENARARISASTIAIIDSIAIKDSPYILSDTRKYHKIQETIIQEKQDFLKKYFRDVE